VIRGKRDERKTERDREREMFMSVLQEGKEFDAMFGG
jgi:hypothetical protein